MNLIKSISAPAIVLLAVGCEQTPAPEPKSPEIRLETAVNNYTRAKGLDFEPGDHFGLFLIAYEGENSPEFGQNRFKDNLMCTKTATGVDMPRVYYPAKGKLDFYAYYPYSVDEDTPDNPQLRLHSVAADQSDPLLYNSSDFLTAAALGIQSSADAVPLVFSHRMSLVNVQLLPGQGLTLQELKNARMTTGMLASDCRVNIATGVVSDVSGAVSIVPNGNQVSLNGDKVSLMSFIAIPQTIPAGTELFDIVTGNIAIGTKHYKYVTDKNIVLESGYKYLMEITLRPTLMQISTRITASPR